MDLVQLVGERVSLRRAGRTFKGLCPFHAEKTPSFTVDPDRRTYKCFGCGEGGDAFDWMIRMEGLDKAGALTTLAERAGVELTRRTATEGEREKRLRSAHETAHFYFRQALRGTDPGRAAAAYLERRGIAAKSGEAFGLGYAPEQRDGLVSYLRRKGFSDDESLGAGLAVATERSGLVDRFRDRLIVPIRDGRGRIIAFGGRAMRPDQPAKYINSPQTLLFNKSATLYALDAARAAIRRAGRAVIVEGYFDAIVAHQEGFDTVVASMGTALTEDQYRVLEAMKIERAVVAFDADEAGSRSAESRGRELARVARRASSRAGRGALSARTGLGVYVALLPGGDPDELIRRDRDAFAAVIEAAKPALEFVIERTAGRHDLGGPDGRRHFLAEALPLLADEPDALTRELYLGMLSRLTGVEQDALRRSAVADPAGGDRLARRAPHAGSPEAGVPAATKQIAVAERYLMALLGQFPEEAERVELAPDDLTDPEHREIFELLRAGERPSAGFPAELAGALQAASSGAVEASGMDPEQAALAIGTAALRLRERNLRHRLSVARASLARDTGETDAIDTEVARLGEELDALMRARERRGRRTGNEEREEDR